MLDFDESRYPFSSAIEFFRQGYWREPASLHLLFAYLAVAVMILLLCRQKRTTGQKLVALYFALTPFNNFAFQVGGAGLGDIFGVLAALYFVVSSSLGLRPLASHPISNFLLFAGATFSLHALVIEMIYPSLNEGLLSTRAALLAKIFVLAFSILLFAAEYQSDDGIDWFLRQIVNFALLGIFVYFLQAFLLFREIVPYGLFLGAGFVPVPTFGSVSIERGHFGKFLTPLFPLFLLSVQRQKRYFAFAAFVLVTLVNISASSLVYFAGYVLLTALAFYRRFWRASTLAVTVSFVLALTAALVWVRDILGPVAEKMYTLAIQGDSAGGRGFSVLWDYLTRYPLGLSYGGSTIRTPSGMDEINSGFFAFISQLSFLAPLFIFGIAFLSFRAFYVSRTLESSTRRILLVGVLMMLVIFFADVLWFVPTIWAPLIFCQQLLKLQPGVAIASA